MRSRYTKSTRANMIAPSHKRYEYKFITPVGNIGFWYFNGLDEAILQASMSGMKFVHIKDRKTTIIYDAEAINLKLKKLAQ